eukprot:gene9455-9535_t
MNPVFEQLPTTIFEVMSRLAAEHKAVNLGQGFPDDPGPLDVREKAAEAVLFGWNQYPPMMGLPELRSAIAAHYGRFQQLDLDVSEIMVTSGATEAIAGALLALISPGDEVVLFQPMYDAYLPLVLRAGGVPRFVTLKPPQWHFSASDLAGAFTSRTKLVLFNNPLNPAGVVYGRDQLELLAHFCIKHDAIAICDEVWEHVIFDGLAHISMMNIAGMRERTVKIGSAGKMFSLTGWKVGLVAAAPNLMRGLAKAHQFLTFTTPPNLQTAVAYGLMKDDAFFSGQRDNLQASRDYFVAGLLRLGLDVLPSQGTYFVNMDCARFGMADEDFCKKLVADFGVATIPVSAFYGQDHVRTIVRFCFAKKRETLDAALERLESAVKVMG